MNRSDFSIEVGLREAGHAGDRVAPEAHAVDEHIGLIEHRFYPVFEGKYMKIPCFGAETGVKQLLGITRNV